MEQVVQVVQEDDDEVEDAADHDKTLTQKEVDDIQEEEHDIQEEVHDIQVVQESDDIAEAEALHLLLITPPQSVQSVVGIVEEVAKAKLKRGRPEGSKNKPKDPSAVASKSKKQAKKPKTTD